MEPTNNTVIDQTRSDQRESVPANRIGAAFAHARQEGRGTLIPYFMCGYPSAAQSVRLILAAAEGGADIIELGMPFSDPLADGATIQHAGHVALEGGMTINGCLEIAGQVAAQSDVPLILMGYYNPVLAYGLERFCTAARAHGVCGLIIPDLPPEEATPLQQAARDNGLALIFLVPPTAPDERIASIVAQAVQGYAGFIYCVSLSGVTGMRKELPPHLRSFISRVNGYTKPRELPLAVGFGLSTPEHIAEVTSYADGAVVGSALVHLIDQRAESEQAEAIKTYIRNLRQK
ncbi:MAG TPA: tryptophan synthase subunit alpha [Ktedonobacteraceae bacterium]|jgi:tryptophan synthase alpha chain|nr:tryptophan synthase subunit alpha [Ktedonobacteraceae bacterium]